MARTYSISGWVRPMGKRAKQVFNYPKQRLFLSMMLPTASKEWQHNLSNLPVGSNGTVNRLKALHLSKAEQNALAKMVKSFFADYRGKR